MNCKPGDLAVVLSPREGGRCAATGLLVEVIEPLRDGIFYPDLGGSAWHNYKPEIGEWFVRFIGGYREDVGNGLMTSYGRMWDHRLKPIRDPGEDARDETLEWLPVPSKEKETA